MYGRGPFWGGRYMRRRGSLLGDLAAGGIGYLMGKQSAQQTQQYQAPQYQAPQTPQYQAPQYQAPQTPQYQAPQHQAPTVAPNQQATAASGTNERLAQIKLLGHLRDSGLLTNDEFEAEKQKILQGF